MKIIPLLLLMYSCAQVPSKAPPQEDLVTVHAALEHARASYLKGCVDAHQALKITSSYPQCLERARAHHLELQRFMDYNEEKKQE